MTSDRKIQANRENAQKSTGPRTSTGKAKVSANAIRHGLSAGSLDVEDLQKRAGALFPEYQGTVIDRERSEELAAIQELLARIRRAKVDALSGAFGSGDFSAALDEYRRIDRYERRAISRRKTVIRSLPGG